MENRFDTLAKALASGLTRRAALRRLGGVGGGLLATLLQPLEAVLGAAKPPKLKKICHDYCHDLHLHGRARKECRDACEECGGPEHLCGGPDAPVCCPCPEGTSACCTTEGTCGGCCPPEKCCPEGCCGPNEVCVDGHCTDTCHAVGLEFCFDVTGQHFCCAETGWICCGTECCAPERCCGGHCCPEGTVCQGSVCCAPAGQACLSLADCCPPLQCVDGVCQAGVVECPPGGAACGGYCCGPYPNAHEYRCGPSLDPLCDANCCFECDFGWASCDGSIETGCECGPEPLVTCAGQDPLTGIGQCCSRFYGPCLPWGCCPGWHCDGSICVPD